MNINVSVKLNKLFPLRYSQLFNTYFHDGDDRECQGDLILIYESPEPSEVELHHCSECMTWEEV